MSVGSWSSFLSTPAAATPGASSSAHVHSSNPARDFGSNESSRARALQMAPGSGSSNGGGGALQQAIRHPKRAREEADDADDMDETSKAGGLQRQVSGEQDPQQAAAHSASASTPDARSAASTPQRRSNLQPQKRQQIDLHVDAPSYQQQQQLHGHSASSSPFLRTHHAHAPHSGTWQTPPSAAHAHPSASLPSSLHGSPALHAHPFRAQPHTPLGHLQLPSVASTPQHATGGSPFFQQHSPHTQQLSHMSLSAAPAQSALHSFPFSAQNSGQLHFAAQQQQQQQQQQQLQAHTLQPHTPSHAQQLQQQAPLASHVPAGNFRPLSAPSSRPMQSILLSASESASLEALSRTGSSSRLSSLSVQATELDLSGRALASPPSSPVNGLDCMRDERDYSTIQHPSTPSRLSPTDELSSTASSASHAHMLRTHSSSGSGASRSVSTAWNHSGAVPPHLSVPSSLQSSHPNSPRDGFVSGSQTAQGPRAGMHGWEQRGRSYSAITDQRPSFSAGSPASPAFAHAHMHASPPYPLPITLSNSAPAHVSQQTPASSPTMCAPPASSPYAYADSINQHPLVGEGSLEIGVGVLYMRPCVEGSAHADGSAMHDGAEAMAED